MSDAPGVRAVQLVAPHVGLILERLEATAAAGPGLDAALVSATAAVVRAANGVDGANGANAVNGVNGVDGVDGAVSSERMSGGLPFGLDASLRPALLFAEQFTVDVSNLGDAHRAGLAAALGDNAFTYAQVVWITDVVGRARVLLDAVVDDANLTVPADRVGGSASLAEPFGDPWTGVQALLDAVPGLQALDPVVTDLARLRLAGHHDCRLCRSLRSYSAIEAGADDDLYAGVGRDDVERSPAIQAALELVDAFAWTPSSPPAGLAAQVRKHWSVEQRVELVLDAARNAANKLAVAFGADAPHVTDGVEIYDVAADGTVVYGLSRPAE